MDSKTLDLLLLIHYGKKKTRAKIKVYLVDEILSVQTKNCRYVGGEREGIQQHFTSRNETGTI